MIKITDEIRKVLPNEKFVVGKIEEHGCKLAISKEFRPCLVLKFDPSVPDFVNPRKEHGAVPDFLYAKDKYRGYGLLLVIEMSSESGKSKTEVKNQLQSGMDNLAKLLQGLSGRDWNSVKAYPVYCGNYNKIRRRKTRKETQFVTFRGDPFAIIKLKPIDSIDNAVAQI